MGYYNFFKHFQRSEGDLSDPIKNICF